MTSTAAQQLAEAVVADGFGAHRAALAALFAGARRRGVNETLVTIAADPDEVDVVRLRALGRLVVAYCATTSAPLDRTPAVAPEPVAVARDLATCGSAA